MKISANGMEIASGNVSCEKGESMKADLSVSAQVDMQREGDSLMLAIGIPGLGSFDIEITLQDIKDAKNAMPTDALGLLVKALMR